MRYSGFVSLMVSVLLVACGHSDAQDLSDALATEMAALQDEIEFPLLLPDYLPAGTDRDPIYYSFDKMASIEFTPLPRGEFDLEENANVSMSQRKMKAGECPRTPPFIPGVQEPYLMEVDGLTIGVTEGDSNARAGVRMDACIEETALTLDVSWSENAPTPVNLTQGMRDQAFKIFKSLENARD